MGGYVMNSNLNIKSCYSISYQDH